jgi:peroxiredoxin
MVGGHLDQPDDACSVTAGNIPAAGDQLVDIQLSVPTSADQRNHLGLTQTENFNPTDIAGELLIIEIFSMYCPHCQREAPAVNRLYQTIQATETLRNRVKMIGIGVGNSEFEVDHFRKHYDIAFPLFADEEFVIHKALGEVRTPFFIISTIGADDRGKVLWTGSGNMDPLETFIERLGSLLEERRSP